MSFVTLNIFPNLHTHFSLIQSFSYCRNIYAFSFYPHSPNMNDVQNIVYLYFLHHAPFRETLHGSIYANNKRRNNSVTALNIPRICAAYAPKPTGKTVRLPVGYSHDQKRNARTIPVVSQPSNEYPCGNYANPKGDYTPFECNNCIRPGLSTNTVPYSYISAVSSFGSGSSAGSLISGNNPLSSTFSAFNPGAGSPSAPNNSNCAFLPLKRNA